MRCVVHTYISCIALGSHAVFSIRASTLAVHYALMTPSHTKMSPLRTDRHLYSSFLI